MAEIYEINTNAILNGNARRDFVGFVGQTAPRIDVTPFHGQYYKILEMFATGEIKRLIISVPPQHGKSEGSSRLLPAWILGREPDTKIAIASYAASLSKSFNRDVQAYMSDQLFAEVFPSVILPQSGDAEIRTSEEFEIIKHKGGVKSVGRGGSLTGYSVDVMILDDIYKDFQEANSPIIRAAAWDWYINVIKTRLHNNSRELIVFTRWNENDLIGQIEQNETVIEPRTIDEIKDVIKSNPKAWIKLNFEAIKESDETEIDPRKLGDVLWATKHSRDTLIEKRNIAPLRFDCMYQGKPESAEGYLYSQFPTYDSKPATISKKCYVDTADTGDDFLCAITYETTADGRVYVTDVLYTQEAMESTERRVPELLRRNGTRQTTIESNNGGRGFARVIQDKTRGFCKVVWFHQSQNKESRILTNAPIVNDILMPFDWEQRFPEFARAVLTYKRIFAANKYDDAPDVLTGIAETERRTAKRRII